MSIPKMQAQAGLYQLTWAEEQINIRVDRIHAEKAGVYGEILIQTTAAGYNPHIHGPVHFNMISTTSRKQLANHLEQVMPTSWNSILEQLCFKVVEAHRQGFPTVDMADMAQPDQVGMRIAPILQEKQPTIFFGEGDSLKSFLSTYMAVITRVGQPNVGLTPEPGNVLYLDYEETAATFWERLNLISTGLGIAIPDGLYWRQMVEPFTAEFAAVNQEVINKGIELVIIDSAAPAALEPETAEMTIAYFKALRALNTTSLTIAHDTKASKGTGVYPFGCYSDDTEVLTDVGWKLHKDVSLLDSVACFDLETSDLLWQRPIKLHVYDYTGPMVRINGGTKASMDSLVTPNHRMVVKPAYPLPTGTTAPYKNPRSWHFKEAQDLLQQIPWQVPYAPNADTTQSGGDVTFARFLGWWISEGCLNDWGPVLTQQEGVLAGQMRETVSAMGYEYRAWVGRSRPHEVDCMQMRVRGATQLGHWLVDNCGNGAYNKHIPDDAFHWSIDARTALFHALMEGDGHQTRPGRWTYTTISPQLADDVQRLAITLGYSGRIGQRPRAKLLHHDIYHVYIGDRKTLTIRGTRNLSTVDYAGKVYCLTVPTGAYVTRRKGAMAIAGNSGFWRNLSRSIFYVKADRNQDNVAISLKHTKANNGRRLSPLGFQFDFGDDEVKVTSVAPGKFDDLAGDVPLHQRIRELLSKGALTSKQVAEELGENPKTVGNRLSEGVTNGQLVHFSGHYGLSVVEL